MHALEALARSTWLIRASLAVVALGLIVRPFLEGTDAPGTTILHGVVLGVAAFAVPRTHWPEATLLAGVWLAAYGASAGPALLIPLGAVLATAGILGLRARRTGSSRPA